MILTYEMTMNERFNMIGLSGRISRVLLVILVNFSVKVTSTTKLLFAIK